MENLISKWEALVVAVEGEVVGEAEAGLKEVAANGFAATVPDYLVPTQTVYKQILYLLEYKMKIFYWFII
jgi:hypothetical protein